MVVKLLSLALCKSHYTIHAYSFRWHTRTSSTNPFLSADQESRREVRKLYTCSFITPAAPSNFLVHMELGVVYIDNEDAEIHSQLVDSKTLFESAFETVSKAKVRCLALNLRG
jgi:hypothetical protein